MATVPTAAQYQAQLVQELGDTPEGLLAGQLPGLWALYPQYTGYRRYLAVKQQALTVLIGDLMRCLNAPTITEEQVNAARAKLAIRQAQAESVATELAQLTSGASAGVAVGRLTATAPVDAPACGPNANDRAYGGDPYRRRGRW